MSICHSIKLIILTLSLTQLSFVQADTLLDRFKFSGEIYNRLEYKSTEAKDQFTHQITGFFNSEYSFDSSLSAILSISTGDESSKPSSRFITPKNGLSRSLQFHKLYVKKKLHWGTFTFGKIKNPLWQFSKSQLVYDNDVAPTGLGYKFLNEVSEEFSYGINAMASSYSYSDRTSQHILNNFFQIVTQYSPGSFSMHAAVAYHDMPTKDKSVDTTPQFTGDNSYDNNTGYLHNYQLLDVTLAFGFNDMILPISVFGNYVKNTAVNNDNEALLAGINLGQLKEINDIKVSYQFRESKKDSVFAAYTNSAWGTTPRGHRVALTTLIGKKQYLGFEWFNVKESISSNAPTSLDKYRINFKVKF